MYEKHIKPTLLDKDIRTRYGDKWHELEHDYISSIFGVEDPIVKEKIYALKYIHNIRKEDISVIAFCKVISTFSDIITNFDVVEDIECTDFLYGLLEYVGLFGEPSHVCNMFSALWLMEARYYRVTPPYKKLVYLMPYIKKYANKNIQYYIETKFPDSIESNMRSIDTIVLARINMGGVDKEAK